MRNFFRNSIFLLFIIATVFLCAKHTFAQSEGKPPYGYPLITPYVTPRPCISNDIQPDGTCPPGSRDERFCPGLDQTDANNYPCASTYEEWLADTTKNFWVYDPEVTSLGRGGERSRQFLLWVLTHTSIDDSPVIMEVWGAARNIALLVILLVTIVLGVGIIVGQTNNFASGIEVMPILVKVGILILYVMLSARLVITIIDVADILMEFFIRTLGVVELFNIYFVSGSNLRGSGGVIHESEVAYRCFVGCSNLNSNNVDMVNTSKFLVKFTNMTYIFLGLCLIIRKVVLWFLVFVAPFLAMLAPFVFIRNTGWIWIGVFFQWVFYGPLFALFLGGLASIWNSAIHIPYIFDFSRVDKIREVVYPTSINILYGGPAQKLGVWNSANYVDTFAEYIIALVMLWTVMILPWWLLRIFRDYCCEGIAAMKNILMAMYSAPPGGGGGGLGPMPTPGKFGKTGIAMPLPTSTTSRVVTRERERETRTIEEHEQATHEVRIERVQDIQKATTQQIVQAVSMQASHITDIARVETNKEHSTIVREHVEKLQNPLRADTATERQKYIAIRNTIMDRAAKGDHQARSVMSVISRSEIQKSVEKERFVGSLPKMVPVVHTIAVKLHISTDKTKTILQSVVQNMAQNTQVVATIAQKADLPEEKTKAVLTSLTKSETIEQTAPAQVATVAQETGVEEEKVKQVVKTVAIAVRNKPEVIKKVAEEQQVDASTVEQVVDNHLPTIAAPEAHIENQVAVSPKVSIEEYEQVKSMWVDQYKRGEVPVTENITDRTSWVDAEMVSLTNVLNKISSSDPKLQAEGLDEVGETLPIFMVNSMSGEELTVYLKAKLEAAKQVRSEHEATKQAVSEVEGKQEYVDIDLAQEGHAAKAETLAAELKEEDDADNEGGGSAPVGGSSINEGFGKNLQGVGTAGEEVGAVAPIQETKQVVTISSAQTKTPEMTEQEKEALVDESAAPEAPEPAPEVVVKKIKARRKPPVIVAQPTETVLPEEKEEDFLTRTTFSQPKEKYLEEAKTFEVQGSVEAEPTVGPLPTSSFDVPPSIDKPLQGVGGPTAGEPESVPQSLLEKLEKKAENSDMQSGGSTEPSSAQTDDDKDKPQKKKDVL